jgi:two-component system KDP operon response regulator KdpE
MAVNHPPEFILCFDIVSVRQKRHEILAKELRTANKAIIILSVQDSEEDIVKALDNGATDYLTKLFRRTLARIRLLFASPTDDCSIFFFLEIYK